jgi:hypothetical protein
LRLLLAVGASRRVFLLVLLLLPTGPLRRLALPRRLLIPLTRRALARVTHRDRAPVAAIADTGNATGCKAGAKQQHGANRGSDYGQGAAARAPSFSFNGYWLVCDRRVRWCFSWWRRCG